MGAGKAVALPSWPGPAGPRPAGPLATVRAGMPRRGNPGTMRLTPPVLTPCIWAIFSSRVIWATMAFALASKSVAAGVASARTLEAIIPETEMQARVSNDWRSMGIHVALTRTAVRHCKLGSGTLMSGGFLPNMPALRCHMANSGPAAGAAVGEDVHSCSCQASMSCRLTWARGRGRRSRLRAWAAAGG